ncbi:Hypothetical predicted protein [Olea europaea subsp. europaea]|uniref:Uncharacterized protein n=1 Tax=Olea europaea subsp. europaea TaxID=158383 RepID=A0A8S0R2A8_OLEEU|nr:Hypothetical predicted protein [Olea europaea subsp. europaea]
MGHKRQNSRLQIPNCWLHIPSNSTIGPDPTPILVLNHHHPIAACTTSPHLQTLSRSHSITILGYKHYPPSPQHHHNHRQQQQQHHRRMNTTIATHQPPH